MESIEKMSQSGATGSSSVVHFRPLLLDGVSNSSFYQIHFCFFLLQCW